MHKFNLIGNTFTHLTDGNLGYSVHGKASRYIEWIRHYDFDSSHATFYIDDAIEDVFHCRTGEKKYAWLLESKWISDEPERILQNINKYSDCFETIFTHNQALIELDSDKFKFVPAQGSWIKDKAIHPKTKLVSMISSNKNYTQGHVDRLGWIKRLRGNLDLYGRGFNYIPNKELGLNDYMFSVVIENGVYETYFTEKILDCFLTGTVPIYIGAPDIGNYFNTDGIIMLTKDFDIKGLSPELYEEKMPAIVDNFNRALEMEVLEDYIWRRYFTK